ncbi:amino acid adenylation domain-containing protein [Streptacidiphilus sp. MAP12-33]|uniref:non-ribosomal peptide synthetase n=1 Tax=Streptacidiphilus sp. MAP12-33 TaxID=3156266 RepID=UPI0035178AF3
MTASTHQTSAPIESDSATWSHPSHHTVRCLRIEGVFDAEAARTALRLLSERQRTEVDFAEERVTGEDAIAHAVREAGRPFDLTRGPLLRLRVLRVSEQQCVLVAVAHRLALDPVMLDAFLVEHAGGYTALRLGTPVVGTTPSDTASSDTDRGAAVLAHLGGPSAEEVAADLDHWLRATEALPVLDLPTDRPRRPRSTRTGGVERFTLPPALARRLRELSGAPDAHSALCAGLAVLLARHTAQRHIPLLVPVRPSSADAWPGRPETDVVLGLRLDGNPTFLDVVEQARAERERAIAHARALPPGSLDTPAGACGDPARQPVPVRFAAWGTDTAPAAPDYHGASCSPVELHLGTAARDLSLSFDLHGEVLRGTLEYDADLYEPVTAQRMVRRLEHLLTAAVADPHTPIAALPVLPPEERALVVSAWNRTERDFPRDRTTASLFEEQVRRDADATAVEHDGVRLTYGQLNTRANLLAHRLIGCGVGPDVPVGICLPRSVGMVVALVAVLKAGGAYLPLDPEHPAQRSSFVVDDARARVVLTDTAHEAAFASTAAHVLCLDAADEAETGAAPTTDPVVEATAEHLAYVIYTSGSTGTPKGVAVTHRALSRLVKGADYAQLGPDEVHLLLSPLSFDASLLALWGSLLNGGTLVLPPSGLPFPDQLKVALQQHRITTLLLVSPQLHVAADQFPEELARVRQLLVGGDVLSPASAAKLLPHLGDTRFLHVYGPTECTLFATWKPIEAVDTSRPTIPIGRPLANTRAYVLDEDLSPLPVGVPGELWLSGEGLAREYLGRPDLTAERFRPDPFDPQGGRIYRTGDLARWLPDGELEFLGRGDDQVKIRGYRIELGELDTALAAYPGVRAVATVVRDDAPGGQALAAYLVGDVRAADAELRAYMQSRVPSYMVPAAFVWLDEMPLTVNGKVDRRALPAPGFGSADQHAAPHTPLEAGVLGAMAESLGLDAVGPDDDFFELGGNSLLLVDLFSRLQGLCPDSGLSLVDLLDNRTATRIAKILSAAPAGGDA